ncbi:PilT protein domain protein [Xylanimonas cellulosilytica DSM 15894]|uniref:Ribonuclease VapC n=1 Tax=Xylanimonas cellulosilytica (strain DSM 15894 / JCM 12276 / CECT 5975 / KCTC 9989 / LMG 20990 / NBRC 107835 / XIL07) TaxID=446471 RepID=D1BZ30_XYLCX|nr:type II toxin-antitoxin system VapC family toxin [Xylanimonas cellulosilytica]ACZ31927.1 PilT protein domain protein [Xylanimonas cellulosilytica DSM 15894]
MAAGFLLDTTVVSELRKSRPDPRVSAWWASQRGADAYISALVVGELRQGVERLRSRHDLTQAEALDSWLTGLVHHYGDNVLPVTAQIAETWGRLDAAPDRPPVIDGLMAATALVHGLTLVTRNVADVERAGVAYVNPFEA